MDATTQIDYQPTYRDRYRRTLTTIKVFNNPVINKNIRDYQRRHNPTKAVRECGDYPIFGKDVSLCDYGGSRLTFTGVSRCNNTLCWDCYHSVRIKKAKTIERALRSITDNPGSKLFFITLTTSRYANPSDVLDIQNKALNSVFGNFKKKLIEMGIRKEGIGTIKALDWTIHPGGKFPFHNHFHCLLSFEDKDDKINDIWVSNYFKDKWTQYINKKGKRYGINAVRVAQDIQRSYSINAAVARYLVKQKGLSLEIAMGGNKNSSQGFSFPEFMILASQHPTDRRLVNIYKTLARVLKGRQIVRIDDVMKEYAGQYDGDLEEVKEPLHKMTFCSNLYEALVSLGSRYHIKNIMFEYWRHNRCSREAQSLISLAAGSLVHRRSVVEWMFYLTGTIYDRRKRSQEVAIC
jgi:hypothetical protein